MTNPMRGDTWRKKIKTREKRRRRRYNCFLCATVKFSHVEVAGVLQCDTAFNVGELQPNVLTPAEFYVNAASED